MNKRVFRLYSAIDLLLPGQISPQTALTIGNFDGVHLGHQTLIKRLVATAKEKELVPAVLSFEPHPRDFFASRHGMSKLPRLSDLTQKASLLRELGVAKFYCLRFTQAVADLTPDSFIERILCQQLRAQYILVGQDFCFGRDRLGGVSLLQEQGMAKGFTVETMKEIVLESQRISSSVIRKELQAGNLAKAQAGLGRPYGIYGRVIYGAQRGRTLGFPTANIKLRHPPALSGVFCVTVSTVAAATGKSPGNLEVQDHPAVANIGWRPTIAAGLEPLLELYLLGFSGSLYGQRLRVDFQQKIREEQKYSNLSDLKEQIIRDVAAAKRFFGQP